MPKETEAYFSEAEEVRIVDAIRAAEVMTSGEIRVHISKRSDTDALEATKDIFAEMRMYNTQQRNAVLVHISLTSKTFAIYGDEGINRKVAYDFWESTRNVMQKHFSEGHLVDGICEGVRMVGDQLKAHFPWDEKDLNELSDDITYD